MDKIGKRAMKRMIYGALISELEKGCIIDSDDPDFVDLACEIQSQIANTFRSKSDARSRH